MAEEFWIASDKRIKVSKFMGVIYIDARRYYKPKKSTKEQEPSPSGLCMTIEEYDKFMSSERSIRAAFDTVPEEYVEPGGVPAHVLMRGSTSAPPNETFGKKSKAPRKK
jgi:hypothetical protein